MPIPENHPSSQLVRHASESWELKPRGALGVRSSFRWDDGWGYRGSVNDRPNYITPAGFAALRAEYEQLFAEERPKLVETIAWAAGNGDRSENGDYIYGRKRLREIDRRLGWLSKRMKAAKVVDPAQQPDTGRAWFGCTITIADEDDNRRTLTLVGDDETDAGKGLIGWNAPLARALRGAAVGDLRRVTLPAGEKEYEVVSVTYPDG